jgi:hypothetical protein
MLVFFKLHHVPFPQKLVTSYCEENGQVMLFNVSQTLSRLNNFRDVFLQLSSAFDFCT